jgi:hypothetical protein
MMIEGCLKRNTGTYPGILKNRIDNCPNKLTWKILQQMVQLFLSPERYGQQQQL